MLDALADRGDDGPMRKLILLLLAACAACTTGAAPEAGRPQATQSAQSAQAQTPAQPAQDGQGDTLARIRALAGTPACSDDSQCRTLALGARACGGPESYLAWSPARTPQAEIQALGERYKEERRAANAASGAMSTCRFMPDPGAVCRAGTCQLATGAAAVAR
jgi:hypothetical protein